ncbi:MAG: PDZ domain-containing protein [Pseudomonadales bacterium]
MHNIKVIISVAILSSLSTGLLVQFWQPIFQTQPDIHTANPLQALIKEPATLYDEQLKQLQQQLAEEVAVRSALAYELEWLQILLADQAAVSTKAGQTNDKSSATSPIKPQYNTELWFDEKLLLVLGINSSDVQDLKERFDQTALEKLYLHNQANRAGRGNRGELLKAIRKLDRSLQQELGDQEYDRLLYATGQNNRVTILDILTNSPAAIADIQKGDIILSYGGEKIYSPSELYKSTTKGSVGELVAIEILRGDEYLVTYLPRGPLGTRFKPTRRIPK